MGGIDLEFNKDRITICGLSSRSATVANSWDASVAGSVSDLRDKGVRLVGHAVVTADMQILRKNGIDTNLNDWEDTMVRHYLLSHDLMKQPNKTEEEEGGGLGFMNLWAMMSLYTDLPNHKLCRGVDCDGPCPSHDVFGYCAVDSWGGLESHYNMKKEYDRRGISESFYRDLMELSQIAYDMEQYGILIDTKYVEELEEQFEEKKAEIFPFDIDSAHNRIYKYFNPRSPVQGIEWFKSNGLEIESNSKEDVRKSLRKLAKKHGYVAEGDKDLLNLLQEADDLPTTLDVLFRLDQYKNEGKGTKGWFDGKYIDNEDICHPRFNVCATSTGRWSSADPNFQNIPARGFGELVRKAIIPRPGYDLCEADESQLELRNVLWLAGVDPAIIGADAFRWLADRSNGQFKLAAEMTNSTERYIAKSVSHAGDYLEGFDLLDGDDLRTKKKFIDNGALIVYNDWEFCGFKVGFNGVNLATRLFGSATWENRKKALLIQEDLYFKQFPMIRQWHRRVLAQIENSGYIKSPTGRFLNLLHVSQDRSNKQGLRDDAKIAAAFLGQGVSADHVQGVILRYKRELHTIPLMMVHDSLAFELPSDYSNKQVKDHFRFLSEETNRIQGFSCPCKVKRGKNWKEMVEI